MKDALKRAGLAKQEPAPRKISKEFREELSDDESLPPRFEGPAMTVALPLGETAPPRRPVPTEADDASSAAEEADAPAGPPARPTSR